MEFEYIPGRRVPRWRVRLADKAWCLGDLLHRLGSWLDGY